MSTKLLTSLDAPRHRDEMAVAKQTRRRLSAGAAKPADIKPVLPEHVGGYAGPRRTVLVVDDERDNRFILATMLRDCGFNVIEADSGRTTIVQFRQTPVDALLTDQFMADGDGWYLLREIAERQRDLPVVLISAAPPNRPAGFPIEFDFARHLLKPLDHSELLRRVGNLLRLDWIESAAVAPLSERPLVCPSETALRELRDMIETGRMSDIEIWAEELKERDQACGPFADKVRCAARVLDLASLADLAKGECARTSGGAGIAREL